MTPAPKRRWFSFSLRTLFVVVTVFCVWLGYQANWIRQRHDLIERQQERYVSSYARANQLASVDERLTVGEISQVGQHITGVVKHDLKAPGLLWLFGEGAVHTLTVIIDVDESDKLLSTSRDELERAKRLFPEANVFPYCLDAGQTIVDHNLKIWEVNNLFDTMHVLPPN